MPKRQPGRRKRSSGSRAKKDTQDFAKSVGGFLPFIGPVLNIDSVYQSGKKLMKSGPKALKNIGKRKTKRIGRRIIKRFKLW